MPIDIPALSEMYRCHFLVIYFVHRKSFLRVLHIFIKIVHWSIIHEVTCVDSDICLELFVSARVATTFGTLILNIIDNQTSVVNKFCHSTTEIDIFICFEVLDIVTPKALSHDESEHRSPFLATSIEYVIDGNI